MSFKEIVEHSYLYIIKGSLERIICFQIDTMLDSMIQMHISEPPNAKKVLLAVDKFYIYKGIWQGIIETLYQKFLPHVNYTFDWKLELTPYTLMLCELSKDLASNKDYDYLKELTGLTDKKLEATYKTEAKEMGLERMGLDYFLESELPTELCPKTRAEQLKLIFRLMNFPPLEELSIFIKKYNSFLSSQLKNLSIAFPEIASKTFPDFGNSEPLHYSFFHFSHPLFQNHGIDEIRQNSEFIEYINELQAIKDEAETDKDKFKDEAICPCCGEKSEVQLPEEILQYRLILQNKKLSKKIGFAYFEEFKENYISTLSDKFYSFLPNINIVENPKCIILVEGESEAASIPLLAFRQRFILSKNNIHVYNSMSKEKLKNDFLSFKDKYPDKKIICLLDSDAIKERDDIERVIKDKKNKYRLVFIKDGTFEDLFDLSVSIKILNELYPEGETITIEDFDPNKDFLSNTKRFMYQKKKATFDKVLFAKTISAKIDVDKIPKEINEVIELAKNFTSKGKFIKK